MRTANGPSPHQKVYFRAISISRASLALLTTPKEEYPRVVPGRSKLVWLKALKNWIRNSIALPPSVIRVLLMRLISQTFSPGVSRMFLPLFPALRIPERTARRCNDP